MLAATFSSRAGLTTLAFPSERPVLIALSQKLVGVGQGLSGQPDRAVEAELRVVTVYSTGKDEDPPTSPIPCKVDLEVVVAFP